MLRFSQTVPLALTTLCGALAAPDPALARAAEETLIINANLISPERADLLEDAWIRLEGERIIGVGSGLVDVGDAAVVDASGGYVIPGLIDSHVHLFHATGLRRGLTDDYQALYAAFQAQQPRSYLFHGFTTLVELSSNPRVTAAFNAAPQHPDVVHCGSWTVLSDGFMALEEPVTERFPNYLIDHYADGHVPTGADPSAHTPRAIVDGVLDAGGRCVKLHYEEALWWPGGAPEFRLPSVEIVRDVVNEAHASGIPVVLHATTPDGHRFGLEAGVDVFAHGMWEWPGQAFDAPEPNAEIVAVADAVAASEIGLQPTIRTIRNTASLFDPTVLEDPAWNDVMPPAYMDYLRTDAQAQRDIFVDMFSRLLPEDRSPSDWPAMQAAFSERYQNLIGSMVADGANPLFATDTAVGGFGWASPPGLAGYWEIQALRDAGVPLATLFSALTINNARAFGLQDEIGTVEIGKRANLLILRENPLTNVTAYNEIDRIILAGEVIDRDTLSVR